MGTRLMTLNEGDTVASVARIAAADLKLTGPVEENGNGNGKADESTEATPDEVVTESA
jgi:hypothetical protein